MSATGADPQSESTPLRRENRTWGLIRRTLPLGRSIGSLFYLISIGLIAGWVIAVFFGVSIFFLMPRSANLEPGVSPSSTKLNASSEETPWLMQSTSRLDRLSSLPHPEPPQDLGDAAADKPRPVMVPGSPITENANQRQTPAEATIAHTAEEPPGQAFTVELGNASTAMGEAVPMPAPRGQLSTAPEPRGTSQSSHSPPNRKPLERRPSNTRTAQPHAPVSAIQDVLQKHSRILK
jgi:hypothetical protein